MINFDFLKDCTGCSVCADACPQSCIRMIKSHYGYVIPSVTKNLCVECNLCEKVCPTFHTQHIKYGAREVLSAFHSDERKRNQGSSGSMFSALAEYVILQQKGIIYGAMINDNLQLLHKRIDNVSDLSLLKKSKYFQSNTESIYIQVKEDLKAGSVVMFVGTPCQCTALYNYLTPALKKRLLLVDFVCHGVPSQDNFSKSMDLIEKSKNCKIVEFRFREKLPNNLHGYYLKMKYEDGCEKNEREDFSYLPFYRGFKSYINFRPSCYHCKYGGVERVSDITLADFWGLEKVDCSIKSITKGYSMVIVNSDKGCNYVHELDAIMNYKVFDVETAIRYNGSYTKCVKDTILSKSFRIAYRYLPYKLVESIFFSRLVSRVQMKLLKTLYK